MSLSFHRVDKTSLEFTQCELPTSACLLPRDLHPPQDIAKGMEISLCQNTSWQMGPPLSEGSCWQHLGMILLTSLLLLNLPETPHTHTHTHSFLCHLYAHLHVSMRTCVCRSVGGQEATRSSGAKHMVHHGPVAYRVSCWVIHEPKGFDSLSSGHWDYMHVPFCLASLHEIPDPTQVFMLSGKQCIGLKHLSNLSPL